MSWFTVLKKDKKDMRLNKDIKINITTLDGRKIKKS